MTTPNPSPPPGVANPPSAAERREAAWTITRPNPGQPPDHFTILVIGDYKEGKSHFACTAPDPLFLQWDPNVATVEKFGHPRVDELNSLPPAEAWRLWDRDLLPAIYNRELECETIVVDSYTFLARALQAATPMRKTRGNEDDTRKWYGDLYDSLKQTTMKLRTISRPFPGDPSRRRYNLVVTVHSQPQYRKMEADSQVVEKYVPQIDGKFTREFGSFFGCVFWAEKYQHRPDVAPGKPPPPIETRFRVWTSSPDKMRNCQDAYGGPPGPFAKLPIWIENTWSALLKGWAIPAPAGNGGNET